MGCFYSTARKDLNKDEQIELDQKLDEEENKFPPIQGGSTTDKELIESIKNETFIPNQVQEIPIQKVENVKKTEEIESNLYQFPPEEAKETSKLENSKLLESKLDSKMESKIESKMESKIESRIEDSNIEDSKIKKKKKKKKGKLFL